MSHRNRIFLLLLRAFGAALIVVASWTFPASAQLPVFLDDPVDPNTGVPHTILPGVPLVVPREDDMGGDLIDPGTIGDVDLVVRTGGTFAGGSIPLPAAGIGAAPAVIAGGSSYGPGTEVTFQVIVSDGLPPSASGNPLTGPELNGRGALVLAYADLDGDGFIGPTSIDGNADLEFERQEAFGLLGRRVALLQNGLATGQIAVALGRPASAGGLGVVVSAAAATGATPPLYLDGPWLGTLLPYLPPLDAVGVYNADGVPRPDLIIELELGDLFLPDPDHPALGTPFAMRLDGLESTVDLMRSTSGAAVGVEFAHALDPVTFVADALRLVLPVLDPAGSSILVEPVDTLAIVPDGPGNGETVLTFPADLLGNATDPPVGGLTIDFEVDAGLAITAPDGDGDLRRETVTFTTASAIELTIDDTGGPGGVNRLVALRDGVPTASLRVDLPDGGALDPMETKTRLKYRPKQLARDDVNLKAVFDADLLVLDPATEAVSLTLTADAIAVYTRTFPSGSFTLSKSGRAMKYKDPKTVTAARVRAFTVVRRKATKPEHKVRFTVKNLDLSSVPAEVTSLTAVLQIGSRTFQAIVPCAANKKGTLTRCQL